MSELQSSSSKRLKPNVELNGSYCIACELPEELVATIFILKGFDYSDFKGGILSICKAWKRAIIHAFVPRVLCLRSISTVCSFFSAFQRPPVHLEEIVVELDFAKEVHAVQDRMNHAEWCASVKKQWRVAIKNRSVIVPETVKTFTVDGHMRSRFATMPISIDASGIPTIDSSREDESRCKALYTGLSYFSSETEEPLPPMGLMNEEVSKATVRSISTHLSKSLPATCPAVSDALIAHAAHYLFLHDRSARDVVSVLWRVDPCCALIAELLLGLSSKIPRICVPVDFAAFVTSAAVPNLTELQFCEVEESDNLRDELFGVNVPPRPSLPTLLSNGYNFIDIAVQEALRELQRSITMQRRILRRFRLLSSHTLQRALQMRPRSVIDHRGFTTLQYCNASVAKPKLDLRKGRTLREEEWKELLTIPSTTSTSSCVGARSIVEKIVESSDVPCVLDLPCGNVQSAGGFDAAFVSRPHVSQVLRCALLHNFQQDVERAACPTLLEMMYPIQDAYQFSVNWNEGSTFSSSFSTLRTMLPISPWPMLKEIDCRVVDVAGLFHQSGLSGLPTSPRQSARSFEDEVALWEHVLSQSPHGDMVTFHRSLLRSVVNRRVDDPNADFIFAIVPILALHVMLPSFAGFNHRSFSCAELYSQSLFPEQSPLQTLMRSDVWRYVAIFPNWNIPVQLLCAYLHSIASSKTGVSGQEQNSWEVQQDELDDFVVHRMNRSAFLSDFPDVATLARDIRVNGPDSIVGVPLQHDMNMFPLIRRPSVTMVQLLGRDVVQIARVDVSSQSEDRTRRTVCRLVGHELRSVFARMTSCVMSGVFTPSEFSAFISECILEATKKKPPKLRLRLCPPWMQRAFDVIDALRTVATPPSSSSPRPHRSPSADPAAFLHHNRDVSITAIFVVSLAASLDYVGPLRSADNDDLRTRCELLRPEIDEWLYILTNRVYEDEFRDANGLCDEEVSVEYVADGDDVAVQFEPDPERGRFPERCQWLAILVMEWRCRLISGTVSASSEIVQRSLDVAADLNAMGTLKSTDASKSSHLCNALDTYRKSVASVRSSFEPYVLDLYGCIFTFLRSAIGDLRKEQQKKYSEHVWKSIKSFLEGQQMREQFLYMVQ